MKIKRQNNAVTLIEMTVIAVVIIVLAAIVLGIASRAETQARENLTCSTLQLINSALDQFSEEFQYQGLYSGLKFPLDCNGFNNVQVNAVLKPALDANTITNPSIGSKDLSYTGCEVMYFLLSLEPDSQRFLDRIDTSLIKPKLPATIAVDGRQYPLLRIVDSWGTTLNYDYYDETLNGSINLHDNQYTRNQLEEILKTKKQFPVVTSAGPDKRFNTDDDITNIDIKE